MNKTTAIIPALILFGSIIWTGCEETLSGTDVNLPYREELVVQGFLIGDDHADTIQITRTLPPLEKWSISKAAVTDAEVTVRSGGEELRMVHVGSGKYVSDGWTAVAGKGYQLSVTWNNLHVEATAAVPRRPEVVGIRFDTVPGGCGRHYDYETDTWTEYDNIDVLVEYAKMGGEMFGARFGYSYTYEGFGSSSYYDSYIYFFRDVDSSGPTNIARVSYQCTNLNELNDSQLDTVFVELLAHQPEFEDYYDTRFDGDGDDLFFGPGGSQPAWNVTGDGFGWFFGRSIVRDTIAFR